MAVEEGLFGKYKQCEFCGRPLPKNYEGDLCPRCKDNQLFREVKHFIRSNNVNEYEVAAHFDIPLKQVKEWIRDGRIEYICVTLPAMRCSSHIRNTVSKMFKTFEPARIFRCVFQRQK